jgi:hypothetical protein
MINITSFGITVTSLGVGKGRELVKQVTKTKENIMKILNYTPHEISIYAEEAFKSLRRVNPTTIYAEEVVGEPILWLPSSGNARIATNTLVHEYPGLQCKVVRTVYGDIEGMDIQDDVDIYIVSLATQTAARAKRSPFAHKLATPFEVVRQQENPSLVLGCMGLSFQSDLSLEPR